MCLAAGKNFSTVCALRFLIGLAESTFYPTFQYLIGSWYKRDELAKRSCIFHTASAVGPLVSGFLQAGVYTDLNGRGGLAGWRWLFIIDGVITVPIALLGYLIMPDLPWTTKPSFLYSQDQLEIARKRMNSVGRKPPAKFTKKKVLGFFLRGMYTHSCRFVNGIGGINSMIFWLKSFNKPGHVVYTIGQINSYPLGIYSLQIVTTLVYAWWSDAVVARWPPILFAGVSVEIFSVIEALSIYFETWSMITYIVLAITPIYTSISRRWAFYYFTGYIGGLSGLIMAWVNELNSHDNESTHYPLLFWSNVAKLTMVFRGNLTTACINFLMIVMASMTLYFQRRDERRAALSEVERTTDATGGNQETRKA
ncbi:major facilitator superfamily domain-containing protein [Russula compacta]|nr:major facilitator superfamily domain-containing protein [Russula compacta]